MKLADWLLGLVFLAAGIAIVARAQTFPSFAGQLYGAAFFPTLVGAGLALIGAAIAVQGALQPGEDGRRALTLDPFLRSPVRVARVASPLFAVALFVVLLPYLGFLASAILVVTPLLLVLGVSPLLALPLGIAACFAVRYVFGTLLRVALPYGPLEAWLL